MIQFLFDSSGKAVAFRRSDTDQYVFDSRGNWIGWLPFDDLDVHTARGNYLGTIVGDRLFHLGQRPYRGYPGYPGYPGYAGYPGYPGHAGHVALPAGARDLADKAGAA